MIFIGIAVFVIIVASTRYVSLGSLAVLWYFPIYITLKFLTSPYFNIAMVLGLIFLTLSYIKHAGNIKRLLNGTERKLFEKKDKKGEPDEND